MPDRSNYGLLFYLLIVIPVIIVPVIIPVVIVLIVLKDFCCHCLGLHIRVSRHGIECFAG